MTEEEARDETQNKTENNNEPRPVTKIWHKRQQKRNLQRIFKRQKVS